VTLREVSTLHVDDGLVSICAPKITDDGIILKPFPHQWSHFLFIVLITGAWLYLLMLQSKHICINIYIYYFHPAHQHYTDEAHKAETVPSVVRYRSMAFRSYWALYRMSHCRLRIAHTLTACSLSALAWFWCPTFVRHQR
jgi:hypothetical protein